MRIAHIALSSVFTEGMRYQENILPQVNAKDGNEVIIIASCQKWVKNKIVRVEEGEKKLLKDLMLYRVRYDFSRFEAIASKIRKSSEVYRIVCEFSPQIIFLHDFQTFEILNLAKYKRQNPEVCFLVDTHADKYNSGSGFISKYMLHGFYYKQMLKMSLDAIDKIFYVNRSTKMFIEKMYKYSGEKLEFMPLGEEIHKLTELERQSIRNSLKVSDTTFLMFHTGKLDKNKKTKELLEIMKEYGSEKFKLVIIGKMEEKYKEELNEYMLDGSVEYLGWMEGEDLVKYLSAGDIYIQPGSASATLQAAICSGNAVIANGMDRYEGIIDGNGWIIEKTEEIPAILSAIEKNPSIIEKMKKKSLEIAKTKLDYAVMAKRMYQIRDSVKK